MKKKTILVIAGPTAVGKTELSIKIAKKLNGEIISADSMQIYKQMDIGSAKIKKEDMEGIKHHLIDIINPDEPFSVADYKKLGSEVIEDIIARGNLPIIVGGTGLYINALTCNMDFTEAECDYEYREKLECLANEFGNSYIHNMLKSVDEDSYSKIHENNRKRVIRALEVFKLTGKPFSSFDAGKEFYESKFNVLYYVLTMDREDLYTRINRRVDIMINLGLEDECIKLKQMGYNSSMQSMQGIGYKEMMYYLDNKISFDESIEMIKKGSRNYAKRQLTWFRRDPRVVFLNKNELDDKVIINKITDDIDIK